MNLNILINIIILCFAFCIHIRLAAQVNSSSNLSNKIDLKEAFEQVILADSLYGKNSLHNSFYYYREAEKKFLENGESTLVAYCQKRMAIIYFDIKAYDDAMVYLINAEKLLDHSSLMLEKAQIFEYIGLINLELEKYEKAENYFLNSKSIRDSIFQPQEKKDYVYNMLNLILVNFIKGNNTKAINYNNEILEIQSKNSSTDPIIICNLGNLYKHTGDTTNSIRFFQKCAYELLIKDDYASVELYHAYFQLFLLTKKLEYQDKYEIIKKALFGEFKGKVTFPNDFDWLKKARKNYFVQDIDFVQSNKLKLQNNYAENVKNPTELIALNYLKEGKLYLAKACIDAFIVEQKNTKKILTGKPWLLKAKVYQAIALSEDERYSALSEDPLTDIISALDKVKEYEKETSQTYMEAFGPPLPGFGPPITDNLYGAFFNKAVDAYNVDDLETSIENFEKALVVVPTDTNSVLNIINAAYNLEPADETKIRNYCKKLIDLNYEKPTGYKYLAQLDLNLAEEMRSEAENAADSAKMLEFYALALETVNAGREVFPEDKDLQTHQINCFIRLDKTDEAIALLEEAVAAKPDKQLYFNLGILYDRTENIEKSAEKYKKAIELDPDYYDANFNLGAMYFTLGSKKIVESGDHKDMNGRFTSDEGKNLEEEGKDLFSKAVPYFEKITKFAPEERQAYEILERMFYYLDKKDELADVRKKLEALPEAGK